MRIYYSDGCASNGPYCPDVVPHQCNVLAGLPARGDLIMIMRSLNSLLTVVIVAAPLTVGVGTAFAAS